MTSNLKENIKPNYIQRVLAFAVSGTYIVDLKDLTSPMGRMSAKLQPDFLSNFLANLIKLQQCKPADGFTTRDEFQKTISIELFGQSVNSVQ